MLSKSVAGLNNYTNIQDIELWSAFVAGDDRAYEVIYERFARSMYLYGMRFTSDHIVVEDSIHDVFVKIYSNRAKLPRIRSVKSYLFVATRNALLNRFKRSKGLVRLDINEDVFNYLNQNIEERIISEELNEQNRKIIEAIEDLLSARQKQLMYYKYVERMSYKEIATIMGINVQSAKNMNQTTLKKIRTNIPDVTVVAGILIGGLKLF